MISTTIGPLFSRISLATLAIVLAAAGCQTGGSDPAGEPHEHEQVSTYPETTDQGLPFSDAVRVGNMLYLSGSIGVTPGTLSLAEGGIQGQTRQAMENIKATLEKYGSSMSKLVKCTIMIEDIEEWGSMNEVYVTFFPGHKPARSAFGADGLALGALVEIECFGTVE
jgi:2-iminobutanoate/2-iminopropanoate deaminase